MTPSGHDENVLPCTMFLVVFKFFIYIYANSYNKSFVKTAFIL